MKKSLQLVFWIALAYSVLCGVVALFVAETTLHPARRPLPASAEDSVRKTVAGLQADLEDAQITAADGAALRGWFIRPSHPNGDAVILLHGLGDNRLGMTGYAELFLRQGYGILMPDARAHGISGGRIATYGLLERDDVRRWFLWLHTKLAPGCIYGFGESMGAAQLLQSLDADTTFCAVVAESSFSNFREIAYDRMGQQFHAGPWVGRTVLRPVVEMALLYVRWKYRLDLTRVSPENAVARAHVPVLLIHGEKDGNIPVRHSRRIARRNATVVFWDVPGADHCGAISASPGQFTARVWNWFAGHKLAAENSGSPVLH